jgi:tripartite-type tricarboxylate transporter receptor subunit TctC
MPVSRWKAAAWVCIATFALATLEARAQSTEAYPAKRIRMVLPQPPGGAVDTISRSLGMRLTEILAQPIVVDNRPGANGILAAETVAKAAPDGYTLFMAVDTNLVVNQNLYAKVPYDPFRDFSPIGVVAKVALALVVHPSMQANSVSELIMLAKSRPGKINYASIGFGTQQHLGMELFKSMAGIHLTHVPYKGTAAAIAEVLAGRSDLMFTGTPSALANAKAGKLKVLAVTSAQRSPLAPELPTMSEAGVPGFELYAWFGLLAPAKTPEPIIERLSKALSESVAHVEFRKVLSSQGIEPLGSSPAAMTALMKSDTDKWAKVIRDSGAKVE